jgi:outer membrane cobalamin receptor
MRSILLSFIVVSVFAACSSSNPTVQNFDPHSEIKDINTSLSILDHLKRVGGLNIMERGGNVEIFMRGINTLSGDNNVLFVVNGSPVGNRYSELTHVLDVYDVRNIRVLRGPLGYQFYGMRGSNGVVEVTTR